MKKVSILIPAYNEEESLPALYPELEKLMAEEPGYDWEVLFVNDGSRDRTAEQLAELRRKDGRVNYVNLSRNFGKENAMLAGFDYVSGDCCVIMDADLQAPPYVKILLKEWKKGFKDVYAKRASRGREPWLRKQFSLLFYRLLDRSTRFDILQNVGDFRLLDRQCIEALRRLRESERYTKGMFCWIGFKKKEILIDRGDRVAGTSNWNFLSLLNLAIEGIVSFTTAPLRLASVLGMLVALVSFGFMTWVLLKSLLWGDPVQGYPTIMTVLLFLGGVQLLSLGIIGEYVGRIFNETKRRPPYLVEDVNGRSPDAR